MLSNRNVPGLKRATWQLATHPFKPGNGKWAPILAHLCAKWEGESERAACVFIFCFYNLF